MLGRCPAHLRRLPRVPTLIVAIAEKAAFALGVFLSPFRRRPTVLVMALADAGMAAVYLMYLAGL